MTTLSAGLTIGLSAVVIYLISGGKRLYWVLPLVILALVIGLKGDFWFKQLPQSFFAAIPLSVSTQAAVTNFLGLAGLGGIAALMVRIARALVPKTARAGAAKRPE